MNGGWLGGYINNELGLMVLGGYIELVFMGIINQLRNLPDIIIMDPITRDAMAINNSGNFSDYYGYQQ